MDGIEEKKTPKGFTIKIVRETMRFTIVNPSGLTEMIQGTASPVPVPKIVFIGSDFDVSHFPERDLTYINSKEGKMSISYQHASSRELKTIYIPIETSSDIVPVIMYHFKDAKEFNSQGVLMALVKYIVVDDSFPKNDMVSLKIRYPQVNVYIQKKKNG